MPPSSRLVPHREHLVAQHSQDKPLSRVRTARRIRLNLRRGFLPWLLEYNISGIARLVRHKRLGVGLRRLREMQEQNLKEYDRRTLRGLKLWMREEPKR